MKAVDKLIQRQKLTKEEFIEILKQQDNPDIRELLKEEAVRLRKHYYGTKVFTRGLIEFTNHCKNDCYYCGIRRSNKNAKRFRLSQEDILACCENGYELGFRTFVLQGGEDVWYTDEKLVEIIRRIKTLYPECAVTLSVGEKSYESYKAYKEAGADRYLLRHETADEQHYGVLHPAEMSLANRKQCLYDLKKLGYQVGAGFMVGSPGQSVETLAEDLLFLQELQPQMVGIGPFIPHHDTCFAEKSAGSVEQTLFLLSVIRILLPTVLLPATTALGSAEAGGRLRGILAGANVVMPNLSPFEVRGKYNLYDNKLSTGSESAQNLEELKKSLGTIGFSVAKSRGDIKNI